MHLLFYIVGLCSTVGNINAASIPETTPMRQIVNFDEIAAGNPLIGITPPTPYKLLSYTAFTVGAPVPNAITIQPLSEHNAAFAPYPLSIPPAKPIISSAYPDSNVTSFDMESIASGCFAATQQGVLAPAFGCTIRYTGINAGSGQEVTFDAKFVVKKFRIFGLAVGPEKVQKVTFPEDFKGLTSLQPSIFKPVLAKKASSTGQMAFDNIIYTAHVKEAT